MISHLASANVLSSSTYHENVTWRVGDSWQQNANAEMGFSSASCTIQGDRSYLQNWLESGLGRHWVAGDSHGNVAWEGMVWGLRLMDQGWQQTRSLDALANRVRVKFSSYYTGTELHVPSPTTWYENADSQATYGLRDQILSIGQKTAAEAINYGQIYLALQAWPGRSREKSDGEGTQLQVDLRGYSATLGWRVYNNTTASGMAQASAVVDSIIAQVGQYVDGVQISPNAEEIPAYHNRDRFALTILSEIARMGDGVAPWQFGMYEDRTFYYQPVPTVPTMIWPKEAAQPYLVGGGLVLPWLIRPGDVIRVPWLMRGHTPIVENIWRDPMTVVVREVATKMPYSVSLTGTHDERLEVLLQRIQLRK